jgi:steroid 5-alpha reductase family enzyme
MVPVESVIVLFSKSEIRIALPSKKVFNLIVGLIKSGMFRYTRNPNYLGEMLVYGGFGLLVKHYWMYLVLTVAWGVMFNLNMYLKDHDSLKFKVIYIIFEEGWEQY